MRYTGILSLALFAILVPLGCDTKTSSSPDNNSKVSNAKEKIGDAEKATAAAAKAKRDEYVREMSKRLDELNLKYDELSDRAAKAEGQGKKDLEKKLEAAKVKRDVAAKKLSEVKEASLDRWEKVKDGVGSAFDDLKKVFE